MVDVQTIGVLVTATSVTIAAIYYMFTLRINMKTQELTLKTQQQNLETRQAQILMSLYQRWSEPEFQEAYNEVSEWKWRDYDDFMEKYGWVSNPGKWSKRMQVAIFFEGLGVLVKRGLIDPGLVDDLMSSYIIEYWQKNEQFIVEWRKRSNQATIAEWQEYLYNVIYEIWKKQHPEPEARP
jgi:hypothetical protein